jgi:hypothetical protein
MSIDWLHEIEQDIDNGKEILACPGMARNQWIIDKPLDELKKLAKRAADNRKMTTKVVRLISKHDTLVGHSFLVPTRINEPGSRGEPNIDWAIVETKEAAEMMRDVRRGSSPYFGMEEVEVLEPTIVEE